MFKKAQSCLNIQVMENTQNYNKGSNSNGRLNELLHALPISLLFDIAYHFKKKNQIFQRVPINRNKSVKNMRQMGYIIKIKNNLCFNRHT